MQFNLNHRSGMLGSKSFLLHLVLVPHFFLHLLLDPFSISFSIFFSISFATVPTSFKTPLPAINQPIKTILIDLYIQISPVISIPLGRASIYNGCMLVTGDVLYVKQRLGTERCIRITNISLERVCLFRSEGRRDEKGGKNGIGCVNR